MMQDPASAPPAPPVIVQDFPFPGQPAPWESMPAPVFLLIFLAIIGGAVAILWPLMRAIARRIEGKVAGDPALLQELDHLRSRVGDLEHLQGRVGELEERLDFAERLLARKSDPREIGH